MRNKKQQQFIDDLYKRKRNEAIRKYGDAYLAYEINCEFFNIAPMEFDGDDTMNKKSIEHEILESEVEGLFARGEQVPYELKEKLLRLNRPDLFDENGNPTIDINSVGNPSN